MPRRKGNGKTTAVNSTRGINALVDILLLRPPAAAAVDDHFELQKGGKRGTTPIPSGGGVYPLPCLRP